MALFEYMKEPIEIVEPCGATYGSLLVLHKQHYIG